VKGSLGEQSPNIHRREVRAFDALDRSTPNGGRDFWHRLAAPLGPSVLYYCKSGSGASLGALSVNPSLTGWRILRDCSPFDRGNYVQRRCGHLPLVMAVGPTCVLLSDEACCVSEAVCFWLLYAVGVFRASREVRAVDLIFSRVSALQRSDR
jgi:hypothetical protein